MIQCPGINIVAVRPGAFNPVARSDHIRIPWQHNFSVKFILTKQQTVRLLESTYVIILSFLQSLERMSSRSGRTRGLEVQDYIRSLIIVRTNFRTYHEAHWHSLLCKNRIDSFRSKLRYHITLSCVILIIKTDLEYDSRFPFNSYIIT
jgi:hypothetical protein